MGEQFRLPLGNTSQPPSCSPAVPSQPFVLPTGPAGQTEIEILKRRGQSRGTVVAVVVDPTPQNGIERASQLIQGGAGASMEPPAPNGVTDTLGSFRAHRRTEGDEERTPPIFRLSSPKRVPEKVELRAGVITSSIVILTKDHVGLLGMQLQPTVAQSLIQLPPQPQSLCFTFAMTHGIIRVAFKRNGRAIPGHPTVKRIMQKQIRQQGANHAPYAKGNFGCLWDFLVGLESADRYRAGASTYPGWSVG